VLSEGAGDRAHIQIERLLHTEARRSKIWQGLAGETVFTSSYLLMEFHRTIIQDICYVRSVVETECGEDAQGGFLDRDHLSGRQGERTDLAS